MRRVTCYLSFRRLEFLPVVVTFTLLSVLVITIFVQRDNSRRRKWIDLSADFVEQANTLGVKLPPGGIGAIHLPQCEADELILLGCYCPREQIDRRLPNLSPSLRDHLYSISEDDGFAPVLVWLSRGHVLAINRAMFMVGGANCTLNVWQLNGPREIKVIKEKSSINGFLGISFVED